MNNAIETIRYEGEGIGGVAEFQGWQALLLNYLPRLNPNEIDSLQRHTETDEIFILLSGRVILFSAGNGEAPSEKLEAVSLEMGRLYRVPRNVWHTQAMTPEARVALVENSDTIAENSPRKPIDSAQRQQITDAARRLWP